MGWGNGGGEDKGENGGVRWAKMGKKERSLRCRRAEEEKEE